jgi:tRNA(Ile)-lysidine synthase
VTGSGNPDVYSAFVRAVNQHGMIPGCGRVVAAVSGGPDSVCLLDCLVRYAGDESPERVIVAHLNHGLRAAATADAAFVRDLAERCGLRCAIGEEDVAAYAREHAVSVECAGRTVRYEFLARTAVDFDATAVAVAHHADDQAETVLMRVLRGTGLRGLSGMPPLRPFGSPGHGLRLVRPLLEVTRRQIEEHCERHALAYRTDETNDDTAFRRNFVRRELLPAVRAHLQPDVTAVLCRLASIARETDAYMAGAVSSFVASVRPGAEFRAGLDAWLGMHRAERAPALAEAFRRASGGLALSYEQIVAVIDRFDGERACVLDLRGGWTASLGLDALRLVPPGDDAEPETEGWGVVLPVPGTAALPGGGFVSAEVRPRARGNAPPRARDTDSTQEWLDFDALEAPRSLTVRSRMGGDRFRPLGSPGAKSLKRFLIDQKVPARSRARIPVVVVPGGAIACVGGLRIADHAKVTDATTSVLVLEFRATGESSGRTDAGASD